jgi:hypothetical protein
MAEHKNKPSIMDRATFVEHCLLVYMSSGNRTPQQVSGTIPTYESRYDAFVELVKGLNAEQYSALSFVCELAVPYNK